MVKQYSLPDFLGKSKSTIVVDVRTPLEFVQGHITGAVNIPIFTNEERVLVGTTYKQQGRQPAILLGFELTGPKWAEFIRKAEEVAPDKKILVHCWRGGMRSGAMAWAFDLYGFEVGTLKGGYKAFRRAGIDAFSKTYPFMILSGSTGSAKTKILQALKSLGEQVIDLEDLAKHQGSSFGSMGKLEQPSQEQFENLFGSELQEMDCSKRIWLEDESVTIGKRVIPKPIWDQMRKAQVVKIDIPKDERIEFLNEDYGNLDKDFLKASVLRISKRLGPLETKLTLRAIDEGRMKDFIKQVLVYYDKTYAKGINSRSQDSIYTLPLNQINPVENAKAILNFANQI
ncbi:MAG: tRNA 2-selenouridine(34) synthase MnmH [Bacteroidetes bacterium]|nr:tRNA 2-selenouridine(34) synthase MnmH [Bacteroidota bacterium]MBU1486171.1 tRNA 2-selenouridine(34) synthase MnmH [Bacteroidota bacterium]MBU2046106.1 tRNA 2-selenouridine(34) synthase MnmH [Bacteroidota bacterium]MBU2267049.1 tRNA 2-selenouridine(34) synthase MnmH [Bacteroidota bacterium]MBU2376570.1 tRNA 2-selenouridine(34) synthase MnmH [Bacteroidota bacterium]